MDGDSMGSIDSTHLPRLATPQVSLRPSPPPLQTKLGVEMDVSSFGKVKPKVVSFPRRRDAELAERGTGYLLLPTKGAQALPSLKLTAGQLTNLKIGRPKPKPKKEAASSFQPSIFRCAVSFREGSLFGNDPPCICPCLFWGRRRDVHLDSVPSKGGWSKNIVV